MKSSRIFIEKSSESNKQRVIHSYWISYEDYDFNVFRKSMYLYVFFNLMIKATVLPKH